MRYLSIIFCPVCSPVKSHQAGGMIKGFLPCLSAAILVFLLFASSWAQCPEDTDDLGLCDTLHVVPWDTDTCFVACWAGGCSTICVNNPGEDFPRFLFVPILVTHDSNTFWWESESQWVQDSIAAFTVPLEFTHSNPSAYCSLSSQFNNTSAIIQYDPNFVRSVWRHFQPSEFDSNRMVLLAEQFAGLDWANRVFFITNDSSWYYFGDDSVFTPPHMWMSLIPTNPTNRRWWEGDRTLLVTLTFTIEDTMHVCIDSTFWPPSSKLSFARHDAQVYQPRHNLPQCVWVGPTQPDFTIEAAPDTDFVLPGESANYQVILTSQFGYSSPCTLTATGLPDDASVEFDPNPVTPTDTSLLTVSTAETTPPGNYTLTVTSAELGKGQIEHSTQVVLRVSRVDTMFIVAYSPVDLIVTDPAEDSISLWFNTILDADYDTTADLNGDGDKDDSVTIPHPYVGEYLIRVIREPDAADDDTFSIGIRVDGGSQFLLVQGDTVPPAGEMISYSYDCPAYLRGDLNRDHATDIADVVFLINYLFLWQSPPEPLELGDVNCDESIDVGDLMYLINYLFLGTSAPCSGPVTGFS